MAEPPSVGGCGLTSPHRGNYTVLMRPGHPPRAPAIVPSSLPTSLASSTARSLPPTPMAPSFPNRDNKKRASSGSPPTPPRHGRSTRPGTDGDRSRRHVNPGGAEQSHSAPNPRDAPSASTTSSTAEARDWRPVQRQPWEYDRVSHTICHRHGCIPCSQYRDHVQDTEELGVASYRAAQQAMQRDLAETAWLSSYAAGHRDALHDRASESRPAPSATIVR